MSKTQPRASDLLRALVRKLFGAPERVDKLLCKWADVASEHSAAFTDALHALLKALLFSPARFVVRNGAVFVDTTDAVLFFDYTDMVGENEQLVYKGLVGSAPACALDAELDFTPVARRLFILFGAVAANEEMYGVFYDSVCVTVQHMSVAAKTPSEKERIGAFARFVYAPPMCDKRRDGWNPYTTFFPRPT